MLKTITIERFKSLNKVQLELGPLNIFIGTNASGKSNFFDAMRVLQGIGYGLTVDEIFDGKPKSTTLIAWDGIRGGSTGARSQLPSIANPDFIRIGASANVNKDTYEYDIKLDAEHGLIRYEQLIRNGAPLYRTDDPAERAKPILYVSLHAPLSSRKENITSALEDRPILGQLIDALGISSDERQSLTRFAIDISDLQSLDPLPSVLRAYSKRRGAERLGENGEDFAALVQTICEDISLREQYVSWLRELLPLEVEEVAILPGAAGDLLFAIKEGGRTFAAPLLSDETLRFAALASAMFQPDAPAMLLIEEIENGIHPTRLRLLVELLKSKANQGKTQLFVTTHSPYVLAWLKPEDYDHTFICVRAEDGSSQIRPVSSLPHFVEAIQCTPLADLFAEGWLETTL